MANGRIGLDNEALVEEEFGGSGGSGSTTDSDRLEEQQSASGEEDTAAGTWEDVMSVDPYSISAPEVVNPSPDQEAEMTLAPTDGDQQTDPAPPPRTNSEDRPTEDGGGPLDLITENPVMAAAVGAGAFLLLGR